jgi:hypothetical protein
MMKQPVPTTSDSVAERDDFVYPVFSLARTHEYLARKGT